MALISDEVQEGFIDTFADGMLAYDTASKFTCSEIESLAALFREMGRADLAELWLEAHGEGDENPAEVETEDRHYGYGK